MVGRIHPLNETVPLEGQAPATVWLDVRKAGVGPHFRPQGSIVITAHNAARTLNQSLPLLFQHTASCSELLILLDQCTDFHSLSHSDPTNSNNGQLGPNWSATLETVISRLDGFVSSRIKRVRVLIQPTPVWETAGENILMSISDPLKFYVSVQPDNLVEEDGWDLQLLRPLASFGDFFSVSGMLAHALGARTPTMRFIRDRPLIRDPVFSDAPRGAHLKDRDKYYVRDTSSRGPLLFHAQRMQQLAFFDHELYYMDDSDHDLHCKALLLYNWTTGVVALRHADWTRQAKIPLTTRLETAEARNQSRITLSKIKARERFVLATGRRGCLHEQAPRLKQMPPRAENRAMLPLSVVCGAAHVSPHTLTI